MPAVARVGEHVLDLLGPAVLGDPAHEAVAGQRQRMVLDVALEVLGHSRGPGEPDRVAVDQVELGGLGPAQPTGAVDDRVEDLARVGAGAPERLQDLARRLRLLVGMEEPTVRTRAVGGVLDRAFVHRMVLGTPPHLECAPPVAPRATPNRGTLAPRGQPSTLSARGASR